MEQDQSFQALQKELNEQLNKDLKDKKYMKTLLITTSKSGIAKTNNYELLNFVTSFFCSVYFLSRTFVYINHPILFWSGLIASVLWLAQLVYSWVGYRKLAAINLGIDSVTISIQKLTVLLKHYHIQKRLYLWFAPITIFSALPIPLYEFRGIAIEEMVIHLHWLVYFCALGFISILLTIFISKKYWEFNLSGPLELAKQNLKELQS